MDHVLDASAMIAYLRNEDGADTVEALLLDASHTFHAHQVQITEVYRWFCCTSDEAAAEVAVSRLLGAGVTLCDELSLEESKQAARWQSIIHMSTADAIALTLTQRLSGTFVTADRHDLAPVQSLGLLPIQFIRSASRRKGLRARLEQKLTDVITQLQILDVQEGVVGTWRDQLRRA